MKISERLFRHVWVWSIAAALTVGVTAVPAQGQLLRGTLLDQRNGFPVPEAQLTLLRNDQVVLTTLTDSAGFFRLPIPEAGKYVLEAERMGYARSRSHPIKINPPDTITVEVAIHPEALLLEPLVVTAKSSYGRASFRNHKELGKGVFFTPEMVDSINPKHPAEVLWKADKTFFIWRFGDRKPIPSIRTTLGSGCLSYMLNRNHVNPSFYPGLWEGSPLEFLKGEDVVAVEYYRHISEVPPDMFDFAYVDGYRGMPQMCGLVIFWTRAGW